MAHFKLELLTPINVTDADTSFLTSVITDFSSQPLNTTKPSGSLTSLSQATTSFAFSFDEKLNIHTNADKELTFSMNKKVGAGSEGIDNPYALALQVGSQLVLTDKHNREYIFIVTQIQYKFSDINTTYQYTCKDLFNYQLTRQNDGYTINNDPSTLDFIGAKTADGGIVNKIVPDCYIHYNYIPTQLGLYCTTAHQLKLFCDGVLPTDISVPLLSDLTDILDICKPVYTDVLLQETLPFANSGSAAAILKALAAEIGCMVQVYEQRYAISDAPSSPIKFQLYFGLEPIKNDRYSGLTYSPNNDIQSMNLTLGGDSLTTALTINSHTLGDEEISLFPSVPGFFSTLFNTADFGNSEHKYYDGMFTDLINGEKYHQEFNSTARTELTVPLEFLEATTNLAGTQWSINELITSMPRQRFICDFTVTTPSNEKLEFKQIIFARGKIIYVYGDHNEELEVFQAPNRGAEDYYRHIEFSNLGTGLVDPTFIRWLNLNAVCTSQHGYGVLLDLKLNYLYPYVSFEYDHNLTRYFSINNRSNALYLYITGTNEQNVVQTLVVAEGEQINFDLMKNSQNQIVTNYQCYLATPSNEFIETGVVDCYLWLHRNYTEEEYAFAQIADACPGLENKLYDFSYFVQSNILSQSEYEELGSLLTNDLRIINGQLMSHGTTYLEAIQSRIKHLSQLESEIDLLSATFQADVVAPYQTTGQISSSLEKVHNLYNQFFSKTADHQTIPSLLNYNELIEDTGDKYLNAEQRFLKNIYQFEQYFNAPCGFNTQNLHTYTLTGNMPDFAPNSTIHYISFGNNSFVSAGQTVNNTMQLKAASYSGDRPVVQFFTLANQTYVPYPIISSNNYTNYYVAQTHPEDFVEVTSQHTFNENHAYYVSLEHYAKILQKDVSELNASNDPRIVTIADQTAIRLTERELMTIFLRCHPNQYCVHLNNHYIPFDGMRYRLDDACLGVTDGAADNIMAKTAEAAEKVFQSINPLILYPPTEKDKDKDPNAWWDYAGNGYKYSFPLSSLYGYGSAYEQRDDQYVQVNNYGQTDQEYSDWMAEHPDDTTAVAPAQYKKYQLIPFISGLPGGSNEVSSLSLEDYINYVNKTESEFSYYSLTRHGNGGAFGAAGGAAAVTGSALLITAAAKGLAVAGAAMAAIPIAGGICLGAGLLVTLALGLGLGLMNDEINCAWHQTYDAFRYFTPYYKDGAGKHGLIGEPKDIQDIYKTEIKEVFNRSDLSSTDYTGYTNQHGRDSYYAIYARAADSAGMNTSLTRKPSSNGADPANFAGDYYNYYSLIAATYSLDLACAKTTPTAEAPIRPSSLYVNDHKYYRPVKYSESLRRTSKYYQVILSISEVSKADLINNRSNWLLFTDKTCYPRFDKITNGVKENLTALPKFNSLQFSGLLPYLEPLTLDGLTTAQGHNNMSVAELYSVLGLSSMFDPFDATDLEDELLAEYLYCFTSSTDEGQTVNFAVLLVEEQEYDIAVINNNPSVLDGTAGGGNYFTINPLDKNCDPYTIYTSDTNFPVSLHKSSTAIFANSGSFKETEDDEPITVSLGYQAIEAENFKAVTEDDGSLYSRDTNALNHGFYAPNSDGTYKRIYTIKQLQALNEKPQLYMFNNLSTEQLVYSDSLDITFQIPLYLHTLSFNQDGEITTNIAVIDPSNHVIRTNGATLNEPQLEEIVYNNITYSTYLSIEDKGSLAISQFSNGFFGYMYHEKNNQPLLQEYALVIETQLTTYGMQAASASKSCRFFLPDSWTPRQDSDRNFFSSNILIPVYNTSADNENVQITDLKLNPLYIPKVAIVKEYYKGVYTHLLPKYQGTYGTSLVEANTTNQKLVNPHNYISAGEGCANNSGIIQAATHLKDDTESVEEFLSHGTVEEIGKQVYYQHQQGGTQGKDITLQLSQKTNFNKYDGGYGLKFYALKHFYTSRELTKYNNLLIEKQQKQQQIYNRFPGVLLESVYSNDKAATSEELLRLAQLSFKDQRRPERGYTLVIHDLASLQGYKGQILHIGDPILLHAIDYYDTFVNVYDALNQYLFISDISYTLRSDTDVTLTINSIKYQEKVMQKIVQLIK